MKKVVLLISLIAMLSGILSLPALAVKSTEDPAATTITAPSTEPTAPPTEPAETPTEPTETPTEPAETPTEPTETPTEPTETPTEPTETPTEPTETPTEPAETPTAPAPSPVAPAPVGAHTIHVQAGDVTLISDSVAQLREDAAARYLAEIEAYRCFPVVFNLNDLPSSVSTLAISGNFLASLYATCQTIGVAPPEFLKLVSGIRENAWSFSDLQLQAAFPSNNTPLSLPASVTVEFIPEPGSHRGVLFVSENNSGQWQINEQNFYSSPFPYILMVVLLILINLVAVVVVNLIIIRIYRSNH